MMNPEQINTALAGWCKVKEYVGRDSPDYQASYARTVWSRCKHFHDNVDFYSDLNAVHEAEMKLNFGQLVIYFSTLVDVAWKQKNEARIATAPQRCEALLRTLGLWI